eukprot:9502668-Pyramimonas_sp.AAC.1
MRRGYTGNATGCPSKSETMVATRSNARHLVATAGYNSKRCSGSGWGEIDFEVHPYGGGDGLAGVGGDADVAGIVGRTIG